MNETYIVVYVGDSASIERLSKEQLLKRLNEHWWGDAPLCDVATFDQMLKRNGGHSIDMMETRGLFIIKGDLVVPKAKQVVETWEL